MVLSLITDAKNAISKHSKLGDWNWPMIVYISLCHFAAFHGLTIIHKCAWSTLLLAFWLWPLTGLGITAGAHRLWSHRSYKASFPLRLFLMLANSMANQGSIYHWSRDHRVHHKHSETDADPHNATRGFFFAHMGWLFVKKHRDVIKEGLKLNFDDLSADQCVVWQKKLDPWFSLFMCFALPGYMAQALGDNFWNGFFVAGAVRYIYVLHATWCVNSAAHLYGDHPYDENSWPAENPMVSLVAVGEGWHNWHHKYPFDYAASEFGIFEQFNPTKLMIDFWCMIGLASDRKRALGAWARLKAVKEEQMYGKNQQQPGHEITDKDLSELKKMK
jgi:stearoyl-CoA desaturase (delta-9 desaturase)